MTRKINNVLIKEVQRLMKTVMIVILFHSHQIMLGMIYFNCKAEK